jgi:Flp pilus assembly protein TadG
MAITTIDGIISGISSGINRLPVYKPQISNAASGQFFSLWKSTGGFPIIGNTPTNSEYCDNSTAGALAFNYIGSPASIYIGKLSFVNTVNGLCLIYDRLSMMGGLSGTVTTAQTVNLDAETPKTQNRFANYNELEWFVEWYSDTGSSAVTMTVTYTNQSGTGNRTTTVSLAATMRASRMLQIAPSNGDTGIKSIQSITLSGTTGTAGNFGITALKRISSVGFQSSGVPIIFDFTQCGFPEIKSNTCLSFVMVPASTTTGNLSGEVVLCQG